MRKAIIAFLTLCVGFGAAVTGASAAQPTAPAMALNELTAKLAPATNATYRHYCVRNISSAAIAGAVAGNSADA
jgi:hypothetical protein